MFRMGHFSIEDKKQKLASLIQLAKRPGYSTEGEAAKNAAIRISLKYKIPCEFTKDQFSSTPSRPTASPAKQTAAINWDSALNYYTNTLKPLSWEVFNFVDTKVGRQVRFRKAGFNQEIRVTQRKHGDGSDFDIEHIMRVDKDANGFDCSYTAWMGISLGALLVHLGC